LRLFLALEPPDELRERLGQLADIAQARCGGRRVPDESLHLTLAFLGEVDEAQAEALTRWVETLAIAVGGWRLDAWGLFRRPGILWVGGHAPEPALVKLHGSLWDALEAQGMRARPARFQPHVTLLRRVERPALEGLPPLDLTWPYRRLALLRSLTRHDGARYTALARSA
jgi:RNA 2',3'-cyclic 3'-phosphodiesterase